MPNDEKRPEIKSSAVVASERGDEKCPCGTGRSYARCCSGWHSGLAGANPEELMRSRYSAFVLQNKPYLLATWHLSRRPAQIRFIENQKWLSLTVVEMQLLGSDSAEVEFIARSRVGSSKMITHHERSRFVREGGRWLYVDGSLV